MKRKLENSIRTYSDASVEADTRESALVDIQSYCQDSGMGALKTIIADHLGPFITDKKSSIRENAMNLLVKAVATVLQRATYAMDVTESDAHFLLTFFVQRFDDYDSVGAALRGILHLLSHENGHLVKSEDCGIVLEHMGKMNVPAMVQEWRQAALEIYSVVLSTPAFVEHIAATGAILAMSDAFKDSIWHEKDPRCLLAGLNAAKRLLRRFSKDLTDDILFALFEATSCYFPITFKPPPGDPYGIQPEQLKTLLYHIFSSTPRMSKHVFPMFMVKIESDLAEAKIQSFEGWAICLEEFGTVDHGDGGAETFINSRLVDATLDEVFRSSDENVVTGALLFVKRLVALWSFLSTRSLSKKNSPLISPSFETFVESMLSKSVLEICQAPDALVGRSAARLLQAFASASSTSFITTMIRAVPELKEQHDKSDLPSQRDALREAVALLTDVIDSEISFFDAQSSLSPIFMSMKNLFWTTYLESIGSDASRESVQRKHVSLMALQNMILKPPISLISDSDIEDILSTLSSALLTQRNGAVSSMILKLIIDVLASDRGEKFKQFFLVSVVPKYVNKLTALLAQESTGVEIDSVILGIVLLTLSNLCTIPHYFCSIVSEMYNLVSTHRQKKGWARQAIFKAFAKIVQISTANADNVRWCFEGMLTGNTKALAYSVFDSFISSGTKLNETTVEQMCSIKVLQTLTQRSSREMHLLFLKYVLSQFNGPDGAFSQKSGDISFELSVFSAILGSCRREAMSKLSLVDLNHVVTFLSHLCGSDASSASAIESAGKCLAAIFNKIDLDTKFNDANAIDVWLQHVVNDTLLSPEVDSPKKVLTLSWIGKALIMRGHPVGDKITSILFQSLASTNDEISNAASTSFSLVIEKFVGVLSDACDTNKALFYEQRFFECVMEKLQKCLKTVSPEHRQNYVKAAMLLCKHLTAPALLFRLEGILPLVIEAFSSSQSNLSIAALKTLTIALDESLDTFGSHLHVVIPAVVNLTKYKLCSKASDRLLALNALLRFLKLPYLLIHPFKHQVLVDLEEAIDDECREVRRKAVEVRNEWFVISLVA